MECPWDNCIMIFLMKLKSRRQLHVSSFRNTKFIRVTNVLKSELCMQGVTLHGCVVHVTLFQPY